MLITAERDCITYRYNLLLLYTSLYTLTRIALENENLDSKESNTSAHNTDIVEEGHTILMSYFVSLIC